MRLSLKFTVAFLLGMAIVTAVFSYLRVEREIALFDEDFRNDHAAMGRDLAEAVARVWHLGGEAAALEFVEQANASKSAVVIRWIARGEPGGRDGAASVPAGELADLAREDGVVSLRAGRRGKQWLETYVPVQDEGVWLGTLGLSESFERADEYVRVSMIRMVVRTLLTVAVTGIVALPLGIWLVGRPVRQLVARARALAAGQRPAPFDLRQSDELGDLAREINAMCDRLAEANQRAAAETAARIAAIEQLRHADRLRTVGQLTSGISHELGTPLNVVWERAKMIAKDPAVGPAAADSARIITEQSARMTAIIRQLLKFARPPQPRKTRVELPQVVRSTLDLLKPTLDARRVAVAVDEPDGEWAVSVDVDQIEQVASNLIMNAMQAMPGGGTISIAFSRSRGRPPDSPTAEPSEYLAFSVADGGVGIAPDDLPRVFDPFFTTKDVGEGTGLGLSISLGIVREHGGWIEAVSEPAHGACFAVYLPKDDAACPIPS